MDLSDTQQQFNFLFIVGTAICLCFMSAFFLLLAKSKKVINSHREHLREMKSMFMDEINDMQADYNNSLHKRRQNLEIYLSNIVDIVKSADANKMVDSIKYDQWVEQVSFVYGFIQEEIRDYALDQYFVSSAKSSTHNILRDYLSKHNQVSERKILYSNEGEDFKLDPLTASAVVKALQIARKNGVTEIRSTSDKLIFSPVTENFKRRIKAIANVNQLYSEFENDSVNIRLAK